MQYYIYNTRCRSFFKALGQGTTYHLHLAHLYEAAEAIKILELDNEDGEPLTCILLPVRSPKSQAFLMEHARREEKHSTPTVPENNLDFWLIWDPEDHGFWVADAAGYYEDISHTTHRASLFTLKRAQEIADNNRDRDTGLPEFIPVPAPDLGFVQKHFIELMSDTF